MNKSLKLNFLAHPVRQYHLLMFTNIGTVSTTKRNLIYRMGQKIKLQTLVVHIFTKYRWILQILYFTRHSDAVKVRWYVYSDHFITNFPQNVPVKNFDNRSILGKIWTKDCDLLVWGPPCI